TCMRSPPSAAAIVPVPLIHGLQWLDAILPTASRDPASRPPKQPLDKRVARDWCTSSASLPPAPLAFFELVSANSRTSLLPPGNGNWKKVSRDRRPKPAPKTEMPPSET